MFVLPHLCFIWVLVLSLSIQTAAFQLHNSFSRSTTVPKPGPPVTLLKVTRQQHQESSDPPINLEDYPSIDHANNAIIRMPPQRAEKLLEQMWIRYNETGDALHLPSQVTYTSIMTAWARSNQGKRAALKAEYLLEEMEGKRSKFPHLSPNTVVVNAVLNAWSKSNVRVAVDRCEDILQRMEDMCADRPELQPNTITYNTIIAALSRERGCERRAEAMLERMNKSSEDESKGYSSAPDILSFNTVINCWANSRERNAAHRAEAILRHMEQRLEAEATAVAPNVITYTTVISAWAKSRDSRAAEMAEHVLERMEDAYRNGKNSARPNAMSYNSIINVWAKSNSEIGADRALAIMGLMEKLSTDPDRKDCRPDVFTYTSVIDALAKQCSSKASQQAESLLQHAEKEFLRTGDARLKPNVRTYTSAINAIGRAKQNPERAEAILNRMEEMYEAGNIDAKPDIVSYNAVLNAWGWSQERGKSQRAHAVYKNMLNLSKSGKNRDVRPDIITCNSVLNACAFDNPKDDSERAKLMDIVIQTMEEFQAASPQFGYLNHLTYGNVLNCIGKHMPMSDLRLDLAETTFYQCCQDGHVSALVVTHLANALTEEKFATVMGPSLQSKPGEKVIFDLGKLPRDWTKYAPKARTKRDTRPSQKREGRKVTRETMK